MLWCCMLKHLNSHIIFHFCPSWVSFLYCEVDFNPGPRETARSPRAVRSLRNHLESRGRFLPAQVRDDVTEPA